MIQEQYINTAIQLVFRNTKHQQRSCELVTLVCHRVSCLEEAAGILAAGRGRCVLLSYLPPRQGCRIVLGAWQQKICAWQNA